MSGPSPAAGISGVLARFGWVLRRRGPAGRLRFVLSRAKESRGFCEFTAARSPGARLQAELLPGARLKTPEKEGIKELRAELALMLELLRRGARGASQGTALIESHEGSKGRDLLLRTTSVCNQRCPFCFVPMTGRSAKLSEIERELDAQACLSGARGELTISGGEPTMDPRLPRIITAALRRGFRRFSLQTNGVLLTRPGLLEELIAMGVKSYLVSFHSHKAASYDAITGSRGQYPRAVASLTQLLLRPSCSVTVNVVVNARNYRDLPGLVGFLAKLRAGRSYGVSHNLYFSMINEVGHQKAPSWTVALEDVAPFLRRALARCRKEGLTVARSGGESSFPVCLMSDPARHASQRPVAQDRVRYAEDFSGEAGLIGRAKRPSCRACPYDSRCAGVPAQYARLHGLAALRFKGAR